VRETAEALLEHETLSGVALDAVLSTITRIEDAELWAIDANGASPDQPRDRRSEPEA
jgi:hypothetical protein